MQQKYACLYYKGIRVSKAGSLSSERKDQSVKWGTWVAQSVKRSTLAQVMISRFVGLSPASVSLLSVQSRLGMFLVQPCLGVSPTLAGSKIKKKEAS